MDQNKINFIPTGYNPDYSNLILTIVILFLLFSSFSKMLTTAPAFSKCNFNIN